MVAAHDSDPDHTQPDVFGGNCHVLVQPPKMAP